MELLMVIPFLYPISVESPPPLTPLPLPDLVPRQQQRRDDGRNGRGTAEEGEEEEEEAIMPALRNGHDTAAKVIKLLADLKSKQGTKMYCKQYQPEGRYEVAGGFEVAGLPHAVAAQTLAAPAEAHVQWMQWQRQLLQWEPPGNKVL